MTIGPLRIVIYLRHDRLGSGPCLSVYRSHREILRFDLFSPAHMHVASEGTAPRHYYPAGLEIGAYVELVLADLGRRHPSLLRGSEWIREVFATTESRSGDTVGAMALPKAPKKKAGVPAANVPGHTYRVRDRYSTGQQAPLMMWGEGLSFEDATKLANSLSSKRKSITCRVEDEAVALPPHHAITHNYPVAARMVPDPQLEAMRAGALSTARSVADAANVRAAEMAKESRRLEVLAVEAEKVKSLLLSGVEDPLGNLPVGDDESPDLHDLMGDGAGADMPTAEDLARAPATTPPTLGATGNSARTV